MCAVFTKEGSVLSAPRFLRIAEPCFSLRYFRPSVRYVSSMYDGGVQGRRCLCQRQGTFASVAALLEPDWPVPTP